MADCCAHVHKEKEHVGFLGPNTELYFAILSGIFVTTGFLLDTFTEIGANIPWYLYLAAYFFGGFYTVKEAVEKISQGEFEIDFLMIVAAIGAAFLDKWAEGALLLFLFSLGHALEHFAMGKARKSIASLTDLAPKTALLKKDGATSEVGIEKLNLGDIIVVRPNSKIAADGIIVKGASSINQAPITGESVPVDKKAIADSRQQFKDNNKIPEESHVFAGTINGNSTLEIRVIKEASDSTLNRLVKMV